MTVKQVNDSATRIEVVDVIDPTLDDSAPLSSGVGTPEDDLIITEGENNFIDAQAGNDVIDSGKGEDFVVAGEGADLVNAGNGDDVVLAGSGNDIVIGDDFAKQLVVDPDTGEIAVDFSNAKSANLYLAKAYNPDGTEATLYKKGGTFGVQGNSESGAGGQIGYSFVENDLTGDKKGASEVLSVSVDEHSYAAQVTIDRLFANEGISEDSSVRDINEVGVWTLLRDGIVVERGYFTAGEFNQATLDAYGLNAETDNLKVLEDGNGRSNGTFTIDPQDTGFVAFDEIQFSAAIGHYEANSRGRLDSSDFVVKEVKTVELTSDPNTSNDDHLYGENGDDVLLGVDGDDLLVGDNYYDFFDADSLNLSDARVFNPTNIDGSASEQGSQVGVVGNPESGVPDQLGYTFDPNTLEGESESITYSLGNDTAAAQVSINRLFADEGKDGVNEIGKWTVFNDGVEVASGYFTSQDLDANTLDAHGLTLNDNIKVLGSYNDNSGVFDITLQDTNGQSFDTIEFSAAEGIYENGVLDILDSSDYFVNEIKTIDFDALSQSQEGDDWLDGGKGNDILEGGYGRDVLIGGEGDDLLFGDYSRATAITEGTEEDLTEGKALSPDGTLTELANANGGVGVVGNDESGLSAQIGYSFVEGDESGDKSNFSETLVLYVDEHTVATDIAVDRLFKDEAFNGANEVGKWTVLDNGVEVESGYFTVGDLDAETLATYGINPEVDNVTVLENGNNVSNGTLTISPVDIGTATFDEIQLSAAAGVFDKKGNGFGLDSSDFLVDSVVTYQRDDLLVGGEGNDLIDGGWGLDVVEGGAGDDLIFDNGNDYINGGEGFDVVVAANSPHAVELELTGDSKLQNVEALVGTNQVDSLYLDIDTVAENTNELFIAEIEEFDFTATDFAFSNAEVVEVASGNFNEQVLGYLADSDTSQLHKYTFNNEEGDTVSVFSTVEWDNVEPV
ncbi:calcium-binding protein [Vibrio fluminensis]|uniref:calcium-binding protein n=1 Tax=Vibrio fluminensis TaxID=2783614 RepID=UPI00188831B1|nr:hypothetical protein [Vibrio fluminensis]